MTNMHSNLKYQNIGQTHIQTHAKALHTALRRRHAQRLNCNVLFNEELLSVTKIQHQRIIHTGSMHLYPRTKLHTTFHKDSKKLICFSKLETTKHGIYMTFTLKSVKDSRPHRTRPCLSCTNYRSKNAALCPSIC